MRTRSLMLSAAPAALAIALTAGSAGAETVKMTAVAGAPPNVTNVKALKEVFIPEVNKALAASGKDYKIEWTQAYSSSLAKLTEVLEAIEQGIGHVGLILKTFEESKLPLEQVAYFVPFGDQTPHEVVAVDTAVRKRLPILDKQYLKYNQVFLYSAASDGMDLFTTFPVKSVDDIKGHKIGASGAMGAYLRDTGAVLVTSAMMESYTSIRNGVYEGYIVGTDLAFPFRTYQAAKYRTAINFGATPTSGLTVNQDTWKKLPDFVQKIFREAAVKWSVGIEKIDAGRHQFVLKDLKKHHVISYIMPAQERRKWAKTLPNLAKEWAATQDKKGLPGTEVLNTWMDELRHQHITIARAWDKE